MIKLIIGNRAYSSWSMRGWLAVKHSGEEFEEIVVPMFDEEWEKRREGDEFAPSLGKVPILWDGACVVWDSLAIVEFLADRVGKDRYWPQDESACGMARSMAAEMHSELPIEQHGFPDMTQMTGEMPGTEHTFGQDAPELHPLPPGLDEDMVRRVRSLMPKQPWPQGTNYKVAKELGIKPGLVALAVDELIRRHVFHPQIDGIVFDFGYAEDSSETVQ